MVKFIELNLFQPLRDLLLKNSKVLLSWSVRSDMLQAFNRPHEIGNFGASTAITIYAFYGLFLRDTDVMSAAILSIV